MPEVDHHVLVEERFRGDICSVFKAPKEEPGEGAEAIWSFGSGQDGGKSLVCRHDLHVILHDRQGFRPFPVCHPKLLTRAGRSAVKSTCKRTLCKFRALSRAEKGERKRERKREKERERERKKERERERKREKERERERKREKERERERKRHDETRQSEI